MGTISGIYKRTVGETGWVKLPDDFIIALGLILNSDADNDRVEMEMINGEIVIRKALVIEVLPVIGLTLQKVIEEGLNFTIVEVFRQDSLNVNAPELFTYIEKTFLGGNLYDVMISKGRTKLDIESYVRDLIKKGYEMF